MAGQHLVHLSIGESHLLFCLHPLQIDRRSITSNLSIGFVGQWGLVQNRIIGLALDALLDAPIAGNMVNIQGHLIKSNS